jgi:hypothetical protein
VTRARVDITARDQTAGAFRTAGARLSALASSAKQGALAVAGVGTAYAAATRSATAYADKQAKAIRAAKIGTDTYFGLKLQAREAGVNQETLNSSLVRFTKRLGLAAQGAGAAAKEYERLGIELTDGEGKLRSTEDVMREVIDRISGMESAQERVAATTRFFGDDAAKLELALQGGSAALDENTRRARELGLVLSSETLLAAEKANDDFDLMGEVLQTRETVAIVKLAPVVQTVSAAFVQAVNAMDPLLDLLNESEGATLRSALRFAEMQKTLLRWRAAIPFADVEALNAQMRAQDEIIASVTRKLAALGEQQRKAAELGGLTLDGIQARTAAGAMSTPTAQQQQEQAKAEERERERSLTLQQHVALERLQYEHEQRLGKMMADAGQRRIALRKQQDTITYRSMIGTLQDMSAGLAQHNRAMFRANQVSAIANAIINTREGITAALKLPPPKSFIMAGLVAAKGFSQVAAIKSQSFSGGGGGTTPSAAGSVPVVNDQPIEGSAVGDFQSGGARRARRPLDVVIEGGAITAQAARELAEQVATAFADGIDAKIRVRGF